MYIRTLLEKMSYFWNVHQRENFTLINGKGVYLTGKDQAKSYLDFNSGSAVNSLGYGNERMKESILNQADKIWHLSNHYVNELGENLAETLCVLARLEKAFFVNSGSEGIEFAIKVARKFGYPKGKHEIISLKRGYHGRTMGALSASSNPKYREGFAPLLEGFINANEDISDIESKITKKTTAILLEPIQGAEGIHFLGWDFLKKVRQLCYKNNILLILDEVQTGIGRTGKMFAFEHAGISPDILVLAKGIAGGFPFGAVLSTSNIASSIGSSEHGGTFGGNLLGIAVANSVISQISDKKFLENVCQSSMILDEGLDNLLKSFPKIFLEKRGFGLMKGMKLAENFKASEVVSKLAESENLLCGTANGNILRITPPLIITREEVKSGLEKIHNFFTN